MNKEKVIIYGIGSKMLYNRNYYKNNFDIVGFSDTNPDKKSDIPYKEIPFIYPKNLKKFDYDYIIICSVKEKEIKDFLVNEIGIATEKIKSDHDVYISSFFDNKKHYGNKNLDKTIMLIGRTGKTYGLFWYVNYFAQYIREAEKLGYIPVIDMKNYYNIYLDDDEQGKINAWELFFEQITEVSLDDAYQSANVIHIPDTNYISEGEFAIGNIYYNIEIRKMFCDIVKKYIKLNCQMKEKFKLEYNKIFSKIEGKKVLGVLYRGTDFKNIKPYLHAVQPSVNECVNKVKEKVIEWGMDYIYIATDDEEALVEMKKQFCDKLLYYDRVRFSNTGKKRLAFVSFDREHDRYIKGVDYLMEITLLAKCDSLVAGKAGGTIGALLLNNCSYEKEYFFELGTYGKE